MFAQALLFFVYVEFFDIEYHFLFEASFVVVGNIDFRQAFFYLESYSGHTLCFEWLYAFEKFRYGGYTGSEEFFKLNAFGAAVCRQVFHSLGDSFVESFDLLGVGNFRTRSRDGVGKTEKHRIPVGRNGNPECGGCLLDLLFVCGQRGYVESRVYLGAYADGFYIDYDIDLSPFETAAYGRAHVEFMLAKCIRQSDVEVHLFGVQRFYLDCYLFCSGFGSGFAEPCHRH